MITQLIQNSSYIQLSKRSRKIKMYFRSISCTLMFVNVLFARTFPQNLTSILSTYAKVANFGSNTPTVNEARSSGMSLYTQSSNAKIISGQNLNSRIPYFTTKPSRLSYGVTEMWPAKGEVRERFNPRPYFEYLHVQPKKHQTSSSASNNPAPVYGTPFDSFPVFKGSDQSNGNSKPSGYLSPSETTQDFESKPGDSYSSTYDSYNPPIRENNGNDMPGPVYPPIDSYSPAMNENGGKDTGEAMYSPMDSYQPSDMNEETSKPMNENNGYPGFPYAPPDDMPSKDSMMAPGKETPSEESDTGPDIVPTLQSPHEVHHDYHSHQYQDFGPHIVNTVKPPGPIELPYQDYPPSKYNYHHNHEHSMNGGDSNSDDSGPMDDNGSMDDNGAMDMPKQMPHGVSYHKLPEYLDHDPKEHGYHYPDFYHYDHHPVYHEIKTTTTTTTEAPEERVNNHYSYYYLGRKLWYIPLYFSAYFICYITVLILKSIARHKVNFWHDLHNLGSSRRQGRNLEIEEITRNVTSSIENAQAKYMM